jgi:hypothetical protein
MPVFANDPYNNTLMLQTFRRELLSRRLLTNRWAALHGPSVWELEGPMPTLKMSKTEIGSYVKKIVSAKLQLKVLKR